MTRKELELKKGVRLAQREASPAEALLTVRPEKKEEKKSVSEKNNTDKTADKTEISVKEEVNTDSKKDNKVMHYSIRITSDMANDLELAKFVYGDFAKYVRTLIKKDMEKNRKEYEEIREKRRAMF